MLQYTVLQRLARDKHPSLLGPFDCAEENNVNTFLQVRPIARIFVPDGDRRHRHRRVHLRRLRARRHSGNNAEKLFFLVTDESPEYARVFIPVRPFQPCLMFASRATSLPYSGALERCYTGVGSSLTHKH